PGHVLRIPGERHFLALRLGLQPLERFASMEVAIEADERAVAQLPRVEVVVFDVVGHEAAADRAGGLVAVGAEPLAISLELPARVDRDRKSTRLNSSHR